MDEGSLLDAILGILSGVGAILLVRGVPRRQRRTLNRSDFSDG